MNTFEDAERVREQTREDRLNHLVRAHGAALLAYTTRLTGGDRGWAEDVVQETFVRAWEHLDRLTPELGSVNGWLRRVAHNRVMDGHRRLRGRPMEVDLAEVDAELSIEPDRAGEILDAVLVGQALEELWSEHRAVLVEVFLRDRSTAEAAAVLGIPVGTVKSRVYYALRSLRDSVTDRTLLAG